MGVMKREYERLHFGKSDYQKLLEQEEKERKCGALKTQKSLEKTKSGLRQ